MGIANNTDQDVGYDDDHPHRAQVMLLAATVAAGAVLLAGVAANLYGLLRGDALLGVVGLGLGVTFAVLFDRSLTRLRAAQATPRPAPRRVALDSSTAAPPLCGKLLEAHSEVPEPSSFGPGSRVVFCALDGGGEIARFEMTPGGPQVTIAAGATAGSSSIVAAASTIHTVALAHCATCGSYSIVLS